MARQPDTESLPDAAGVRRVAPRGPLSGTLRAPGSKSHALREMVLAALADGRSRLFDVPPGEDVRRGLEALAALGVSVDVEGTTAVIDGCAGRLPRDRAELDLGGSGTALRFVTCLAALGLGPYRLDGDPTLRGRPAGAVVDALRSRGAEIATTDGRPPLVVRGPVAGVGTIRIDGRRSSQGVSGLLLAGCVVEGGWDVLARGPLASRGYVDLTLHALRSRGVVVESQATADGERFRVPGRLPDAVDSPIDGDWSSAAFLLALGPATGGCVRLTGLPGEGQPDRRILAILNSFGASVREDGRVAEASGDLRTAIDVDLGGAPDLAPLVGALACCVPGATRVRGAAHLVTKESDRIDAVVRAARVLGCAAEPHADGFTVDGPLTRSGTIDTRDDHRIAMAFAVAGASRAAAEAGVTVGIANPGCVAKSFPGFWDALDRLT